MFKFNLGQQVWFMLHNKVRTGKVFGRFCREVNHTYRDSNFGGRQADTWTNQLTYGVARDPLTDEARRRDEFEFSEKELFESKQALVESL